MCKGRKTRPMRPEALALALLLCWPPAAAVAAPSAGADQADQMSVRELMRLDTALALRQLRGGLQGAGKPDNMPPVSHSGKLKLLALYGVGKRLVAEVMVGGERHVYLRDRALPVGVKPHPSTYLLRGISGSCVQLEREGEAHTLCLQPTLGAAQ